MASGYPKFQDIKHYLGIENSNQDALLVATLKRAIATFENMCGRSFVPKTETRYFDSDGEEVISGNRLFLRSGDLLAITTLKVDGLLIPATDYYLSGAPPYYVVKILNSSTYSFKDYGDTPERAIEIVGSWGYETDVPEDVFGAIVRLTAWLYQQKDNAMELDRPVAISNAMVLPATLPSDVEAISKFYKKVI